MCLCGCLREAKRGNDGEGGEGEMIPDRLVIVKLTETEQGKVEDLARHYHRTDEDIIRLIIRDGLRIKRSEEGEDEDE